MIVWTKEVFASELSEEELLAAFKKRFARSLPMNKVDLVFVESVDDAVEGEVAPAEVE